MKKIININLSGRVIPIEDTAYEKLQAYIESLRRYFAKEEDRDEIINDIESRIAELMNEKIRKGTNSITDTDIDEIVASMGKPEELDAVDADTYTSYTSTASASASQQTEPRPQHTYSEKGKKRLYRDSSDKVLGGVCAGLANYMNIDPAIVRLLFAIITFGGFGAGIVIYLLLWMILPARDLDIYGGKKLHRNPEDRIFAGVASGLAAYFHKEAWTIRLLFAAPLILNIVFGILSWPFFHEGSFVPNIIFGSLTGTFIFAYIVLWIVLPEAKSQYQQMEMRGEKVDVNTIRQNVKENTADMKERMKQFGDEVKDSAQKFGTKANEFANTRGKTFAAEFGQAAGRTGRSVGQMIGIIFKAFFLFIAGAIAFALFVALLGLIFSGVALLPLKNFFLDGFWQNAFMWGTLIFFLVVPVVAFIVWLLRRIMKVKSTNNYLGWTFGGLWTLGWISASLLAASIGNDFRASNDKRPSMEIPVQQPTNGKMLLKVSEPEIEFTGEAPWFDMNTNGFDLTADTMRFAEVEIYVQKSEDTNYHVQLKKYARGKTVSEAEKRASETRFNIAYADSALYIGSGLAISKETKFRAQEVRIQLKVPVGKKIRFDGSMRRLNEHGITIRRQNHRQSDDDWGYDYYDYIWYRNNVDYIMTAEGKLVAVDKIEAEKKAAIEDSVNNTLPEDIRRRIEEEKRINEENDKQTERKIKELEREARQRGQRSTGSKPAPKSTDETVAMVKVPLFSLAETFF